MTLIRGIQASTKKKKTEAPRNSERLNPLLEATLSFPSSSKKGKKKKRRKLLLFISFFSGLFSLSKRAAAPKTLTSQQWSWNSVRNQLLFSKSELLIDIRVTWFIMAGSVESLISISELVSTASTKKRVRIFRDDIPAILNNLGQRTCDSDFICHFQ